MALIIETGAGVPGAESYCSVAELTDFAAKHNVAVPAQDSSVETLLRSAADYLTTRPWKGTPASGTQLLAWPRTDVTLYGIDQAGLIPVQVKTAQMHVALEIQANGSMTPAVRPSKYKRTKVDVMYVEINPVAERGAGISLPIVEALLAPLLTTSGMNLATVRV